MNGTSKAPVRAPDGEVVYGILVTYNRPHDVLASVRQVVAQDRPLQALLVIDNSTEPSAAEDSCRALAEARDVDLEWHRLGRNTGPAGAIAYGMQLLLERLRGGDLSRTWVAVFDDDDPLPTCSALADLWASYRQLGLQTHDVGGIGLTGSLLDARTGRLVLPSGEPDFVPVHLIGNGRLPLYRLSAIEEVGVFRPELFFGREELEFGLRMERAGYRLLVPNDCRRRYEPVLGKAPRLPSLRAVPQRTPLSDRATLNHLRILVSYRGWGTAVRYAATLVLADMIRLLVCQGRELRRRALRNVLGSCRIVRTAFNLGRFREA